jgi:hypothetical protein
LAYFLILADDNDDNESLSSDESLSIEFPPPPSAFSSSSPINNTCQFVPVKNPFVQTTIVRSDSGKNRKNPQTILIVFFKFLFYSSSHHYKSRRIMFCMFCRDYI